MKWDYIIVGAGSSGCAVAHELIKAGRSVLVVEAGGWDRSPFVRVAAGQRQACENYDWGYRSQPDPSRHGAFEAWTRGRVLGGSSSINGTMYVRGAAQDFDRWRIPGWSAADIMPLYRDLETSDQLSPWRGRQGPLHVRTVKRPHAVTEAFVRSACELGYPFNADYNGAAQEGVAYAQLSQRGGFRCSSADAFLKPLVRKRNLRLLLNTVAEKLEIKGGRAVSVSLCHNGKRFEESARDIILCGGVINSPKLLMLSGIGDAHDLQRLNIPVILNLPGVGRNLKEHPLVILGYRSRVPTYNLTEGLRQKIQVLAQFLRFGEGPISNLFEAVAFVKSAPTVSTPDLQIIFMPFGYVGRPTGGYELAPYPSVMALLISSYPRSRGRIRLATANPTDTPLIEARLLEQQSDVDTLIRGIRTVRSVMGGQHIGPMLEGELEGGGNGNGSDLEDYVRRSTGISHHSIGTCRMGVDEDSVVGPDQRVANLENVWVADASVIPDHISANINAICMLIGVKLGRYLAGRQ